MNNWCICWFSRIFLLGILLFKGLAARRPYKSFGVKGLTTHHEENSYKTCVLAIDVFLSHTKAEDR
jgi:hypothetical protein